MNIFSRCAASVVVLSTIVAASSARAADAEPVDYLRDIKPLLTKHCLACHSPVRQKSQYRIDTAEGVIRGGASGAAVMPLRSAESPLIHALTGTHDHPRMPPQDEGPPLSADEIDLVRRWIDAGAKAPPEIPQSDPRAHWAFQRVVRPVPPQVNEVAWIRNPLDSFILAEQEKHGVAHAPAANKSALLRRVYLDLLGLPPTRAEQQAFLADESPDAYERVVERLLSRGEYGERWGRHWMDVWRYSDWAGWGKQIRDSQPHIWHWRDWIIEQINADRPYDEMIRSMLAADELTPTDRNELRATGYLARNFKLLSREQWLQDTVEHTAKSFLGLTLNCARCHDHMTDPIEQREYYAFRAIFEPHQVRLDRQPGTADVTIDGLPRVYDKDLTAPTFLFVRGDERNPRKDKPIEPGALAILKVNYQVNDVTLPRAASDPLRQAFVMTDDLAAAERALADARKKSAEQRQVPADKVSEYDRQLGDRDTALAEAKLASLRAVIEVERLEIAGDSSSPAWRKAAETTVAAQRMESITTAERDMFVAANDLKLQDAELSKLKDAAQGNLDDAKVKAQLVKRDAAAKKLADAQAKHKQAVDVQSKPLDGAYTKRKLDTYPTTSSGRRTALARWIVDPSNPLTARVAVNHIWGRHFDRALVATTANFGTQGAAPSHPQLLDWLAAELVQPSQQGVRPWSLKHIQRLIVSSSTYRQAAVNPMSAKQSTDPDNRWVWHFPSRRLEAEVVRDCVLAVAGQLDLTQGGPDIDHQQGLSVKRRSVYFRHAAEKQMTFLKIFDVAGVNECYERRESVMPQQALALANSELSIVQSRLLARRLHDEFGDDHGAFITAVFETIISRPPRDNEQAACITFLADQSKWFRDSAARLTERAQQPLDGSRPSGDPTVRARENLVHAVLNHHEFVTLP